MNRAKYGVMVPVLTFAAISVLPAWEFSQTFGANAAYYSTDHGPLDEGNGGFLPPSYTPGDPAADPGWTGAGGADSDDPGVKKLGSTWGYAGAEVFYRFSAAQPFLAGEGLFAGNNVTFDGQVNLNPVAVFGSVDMSWTPIAFLVFSAGVKGATGWYLPPLNAHGLALNNQSDITNTKTGGFAGFYHMGGTLQFDLEAVVPGEYNHVVMAAAADFEYRRNWSASADDAWYWQADEGRNFNGWKFNGTYVLGWQPPWTVNFIGFLTEHNFWLSPSVSQHSTIASGGWGSDFHSWNFGPLVNVQPAENHGLTILLQFRNGLYISAATAYNRWFELHETTGESYVKLNRLALAYTWKFQS